jgi:hypothetical protein
VSEIAITQLRVPAEFARKLRAAANLVGVEYTTYMLDHLVPFMDADIRRAMEGSKASDKTGDKPRKSDSK